MPHVLSFKTSMHALSWQTGVSVGHALASVHPVTQTLLLMRLTRMLNVSVAVAGGT